MRALVRARRAPRRGRPGPQPPPASPAFETASEAMREQTLSHLSPQTSARATPDPHRAPIAAPGEPAAERKKKKRSFVRFDVEFGGAVFLFRRKTRGAKKKRARPFSGATGARVRNRALIWFS